MTYEQSGPPWVVRIRGGVVQSDGDTFSAGGEPLDALNSLVSGDVISGQWRALPPGWAPRLLVRGGTSGGTYTYRMRNRALVETADQSGSVLANADMPIPIYPSEALEIRVTLTGTVTAEVR